MIMSSNYYYYYYFRYIISIPTLYELFIKDFQIMHDYTIFDTPYLYTVYTSCFQTSIKLTTKI